MGVAIIKGKTSAGVSKSIQVEPTSEAMSALHAKIVAAVALALDASTISALTPLATVSLSSGTISSLTPLATVSLSSGTISSLTPLATVSLSSGTISSLTPPTTVQTTCRGDFLRGSIQRATGTTTYADGDVWGTASDSVITLTNAAAANGGIFILDRITLVTTAATVAGKIFDLHFYSAAPLAIVDNAPFVLDPSSDVPLYLGCIQGLSMEVANASETTAHVTFDCNKQEFKCGAASRDIYVRPVIRGAYAPTSSETLFLIASKID